MAIRPLQYESIEKVFKPLLFYWSMCLVISFWVA
jgi:hypothetical protein